MRFGFVCTAFLTVYVSASSFSNAGTRDVGEVAVIEGDSNIIVTKCAGKNKVHNSHCESRSNRLVSRGICGTYSCAAPKTDSNGNPCPKVSVVFKELAKKFYQTDDDEFNFLIMFTNFAHLVLPDLNNSCVEGGSALFTGVSNSIMGIGKDIFDNGTDFGSSGTLGGVLNMNDLNTRPLDPTQRIGTNNDSVLSQIGQEVGHLWGQGLLRLQSHRRHYRQY